MATVAGSGDALMIKYAGAKSSRVVAHPAIPGGGNVVHRLSYGGCSIVAGSTIAGNTFVIEN